MNPTMEPTKIKGTFYTRFSFLGKQYRYFVMGYFSSQTVLGRLRAESFPGDQKPLESRPDLHHEPDV